MNAASTTDEIRTALVSAAKVYQPQGRSRFKMLAPFREEIRELRSRGASFETIAELLKKHSIKASHETVRRFYREVIEQKSIRKNRSSKRRRQANPMRSRNRGAENSTSKAIERSPASRTERGPRIARIEDL